MNSKKFCELYTAFYGEKLDNLNQLKRQLFDGHELFEFAKFIEHKTNPHPEPESRIISETLYTENKKEVILDVPGKFTTFKGIEFDILNPTPAMIDIEDIAHSLSNQCRWGGHTPFFHSVAEHCLLCAEMAPAPFRLEALMHDASEAYILDVPTPLKALLGNYKEIEDKIMGVIAKKYGINWPLSKTVKEIDKQILNIEWRVIRQNKGRYKGLSREEAKKRFIDKFYKYM